MTKIETLTKKINELKQSHSKKLSELTDQLNSIYFKKFDKNKYLKESIKRLEESKDLESDYDYFNQWLRIDFSEVIDEENETEKDTLDLYLSEKYSIQVDFKNDCIKQWIGPCILINDDGDVLDQDSRKWILSKNDYENENELKELIEKYMQKTGHYPPIVTCDRYGNAFYAKL